MEKIEMVDLVGQYHRLKKEIDAAIFSTIEEGRFINGPQIQAFQKNFEAYLGVRNVIPCANGTDALQIALMSLGLKPGEEVIVPSFTYVATAEVIGLLGLTPVMVDVDYSSFTISVENIEKAITDKTKAVVPVHLFGQSCDMAPIMELAEKYNLYVIEDNAQAVGAEYIYSSQLHKKTGTIGTIGCISFFPSKNLGCYGDGGAIVTNDDELAQKIKMIANHGQRIKYHHDLIGCNSRLDSIQAAVLNVKLQYLDDFAKARILVAGYYDKELSCIEEILLPKHFSYSSHVYHQYTLRVKNGRRNDLQSYLKEKGVPSMVYYPLPLDEQPAFKPISRVAEELHNAKQLCSEVLSIPIHTEMTEESLVYIVEQIKSFFN